MEMLGGSNTQVFDELTKIVNVEEFDLNEKLDPDAFHDWMVSLEDYFEWLLCLNAVRSGLLI